MRQKREKRRLGDIFARILIWFGVLALMLSVAGFVFRFQYRSSAEVTMGQILGRLSEKIPEEADQAALFADLGQGPGALPLMQVSGVVCAGMLSIESLRKEWPVGGVYEDVRKLPCLFRNETRPLLLTIEGMDYEGQFSILRQIMPGDEVVFTDVNGLKYRFSVDYTGTDPGRREDDWDLELRSFMGEETPWCVGCIAK